ncbi:3-hydroxyacyl-CoA dehydrogenase NAD-binding domain-containing protein [Streptomyces peucetius]|nr:hypothetical protein CGZ69_31310 [Streptomyces peucetius subsp. caesius ATCC 27952]
MCATTRTRGDRMRIRIVGTGVMGRGIAQWAATAGHTVELADARQESVGHRRRKPPGTRAR